MKTICSEHKLDCGPECSTWRDERSAAARELSRVLYKAHLCRVSDPLCRELNYLAPVPAIRDRDEDPVLMIWAYALVVHSMLTNDLGLING